MSWQSKSAAVAIAIMAMSLHSSSVQAMPEQGKVVAGQGEIARPDDKTMVINQKTDRLALDWQKFNIAKDEKVHFDQNSKSAIAINRVVGDGRSIIDGSLSATGNVFVINPNGVLFGKNSSVDVGGLVASTANVTDDDLKNFTRGKGDLGLQIAAGREASVINAGTIKAEGGLVALHATTVENTGTIANEGGTTALAAAKNLNIAADTAGKLNFTVNGSLANAKALNSGTLQSDGGYIVMTAKSAGDVMSTVVNNTGIIEAKTLHTNDKGEILLDGGASGQVEVSGTLNASGMEAGQSAGSIKVIGAKTIVNDGTNLLARGMIDGGKIETSGDVLDLGNNLNIDASGDKGNHGTWLLDPLEVIISAKKPTSADHEYDTVVGDTNGKTKNNIIFNDPPSKQNADNAYNSTTWINSGRVGDILSKGTDVIIQAISTSGAASITLDSPIDITVSTSATKNPTLTLDATRNITINQNITAESAGKGLNVMFNADTDGDGMGAVIINADITTNGGNFTSITGGKVTHTSKGSAGKYDQVNVGGAPAREKLDDSKYDPATVGTYFGTYGTSSAAEPRSINTGGGNITLNGEVAIGLNGGTLTLDTGGGDLTVTGLINSGNSYKAYIYGTDDWNNNKMIQDMVNTYLADGTVPAYHYIGITYDRDANNNLIKDGDGYKWSYAAKNYTNAGKNDNIHYVLKALSDTSDSTGGKDFSTINPQWYTTTDAGYGYDAFIVDKASTITVDEYLAYVKKSAPENWKSKYNADTYNAIKNNPAKMATLKSDIAGLIAHNWFLAEQIAENGTQGGAEVGDSYLATITTRLENSLSTPNGQHTLWVGGRGSGVRGRTVDADKNNPATWGPSDPTLMDGFYWVTGPEGTKSTYTDSNGKALKYDAGIKFWDTTSSDWDSGKNGKPAYGFNPTWSTYKAGGRTITQPDNNGPFLTVGYGSDNQWDDANFGGETTWGFVQETNLANSNLVINAGGGNVNLKGDVGKAKALDTLKITNAGEVKFGDTSNKVTSYNHGTVYVDHGLYISGNKVTVGGEIHSGESEETDTSTTLDEKDKDNITILSTGNIEVHGITSNTYNVANADGTTTARGGKISLTSTGKAGVITLGDGVDYNGKNTNGGVLKAASTANDAVVIDAQGTNSKFENKTTSTKAIDTQGKWKIYSASPEQNIFGKNLNSGTDAQWTSSSNKFVANSTNENKFIFQTTPTITLYAEDQLKTYGVDLTTELPSYLKSREEFKGLDGKNHNVNEFTDAFKEEKYTNYIKLPEGKSVTVTSDGAAGTATRDGGAYEATEKSGADKKKAVYDLNVNLNGATALDGYNLNHEDAKLEIKKRPISIMSSGEQTYGNSTYTSWQDEKSGFVNGDDATFTYDHGIKSGSKYENSLNKTTGRTTADADTYNDSVSYSNLIISGKKNADGTDDPDFFNENYTLDTDKSKGTIKVNKADLTLSLKDVATTYGQKFDEGTYGYKKGKDDLVGLANGDGAEAITDALKDTDFIYVNGGVKSDPSNSNVFTQNAGEAYQITATTNKELDNYNIKVINPGTSTVNKAKLTLKVGDTSTTYGSGDWTPYTYTLEGEANGDTSEGIKNNGITVQYTNTGVKSDANNPNIKTQNVGGWALNGDFKLTGDTATNYKIDTGKSSLTGKATVSQAELHLKLKDVSTTYGTAFDTTKYGYAPDKLVMLNGDDTSVVTNTIKNADIAYTNSGDETDPDEIKKGRVTRDADDGYSLSGRTQKTLGNYKVIIDDANSTVDKATLLVDTAGGTKVYGNTAGVKDDLSKAATYHLEGDNNLRSVNGDDADAIKTALKLGAKSDALIGAGDNEKTNNVRYNADGTYGGYEVTPVYETSDPVLKNYTVKAGVKGTEILTPKDVYFYVTGNGKTLGDVVYTVTDPNHPSSSDPINGQLVYGETVMSSYRPDGRLPNGHYGVSTSIDGKTISDKDVYGNYRYHYDGDITVNMPNKPDFEPPVNPPVTPGTGTVTPLPEQPTNPSNTPENTTETTDHKTVWDGERDRGGDRPEDKRVVTLPFFKVLEDKTTHRYGTYDVAKRTTEVKIEPSAQVLPEPNQPATQYRELTTELTTDKGTGKFTLKYNGSRFTILPDDDAAMKLIVVGDETKNRALFEKALHVAFTQMGLEVADLDGVYIHFGKD